MRFGAITSVAAHGDLVAVSVTDAREQDRARLGADLSLPVRAWSRMHECAVGVGPDMLTFSPLGNKLLVANEGEPECRDQNGSATLDDPEGSISVIDLDNGFKVPAARSTSRHSTAMRRS